MVSASDVEITGMQRVIDEGLSPVLDIGCGAGDLAEVLPPDSRWVGLDDSPAQLAQATARPVIQADARHVPFRDGIFGAAVCHWMLYHFDHPTDVIAEAHRVLRDGGLFMASTKSRTEDPELAPDGYPPTTFDAEDAPSIVASVFGDDAVEVQAWDGPFIVLPDVAAITSYARHHSLPLEVAQHVTTPLTLTKRGCFIWARKH